MGTRTKIRIEELSTIDSTLFIRRDLPEIKYPFYVEKLLNDFFESYTVTMTGWKSTVDIRRFEIECPICIDED